MIEKVYCTNSYIIFYVLLSETNLLLLAILLLLGDTLYVPQIDYPL